MVSILINFELSEMSIMRFLSLFAKVLLITILGLLTRIATCPFQMDGRGHFFLVRSILDGWMFVSCSVNISIFLYFLSKLAVFLNFEGVAIPFTLSVAIC